MYSRTRVIRLLLRFAVLAFLACSLEPRVPIITRLAAFGCGNPACTLLGAQLPGLPPLTGLFMVGAWFKGTHDVHWSIRWPSDSVHADFMAVRDSSLVAAQLDSMPLNTALVLTVGLVGGGRASLTWNYR
jgi:hypothetical protein